MISLYSVKILNVAGLSMAKRVADDSVQILIVLVLLESRLSAPTLQFLWVAVGFRAYHLQKNCL